MWRRTLIKKTHKLIYVIFCVLFLILLVLLIILRHGLGEKPEKKEEVVASCDYFNGEVVEITETYFVLKPIAEWNWKEVTRVKIPKTKASFNVGDLIRVAFNSKAMEWKEDEVLIPMTFACYPLTEDGQLK
jgi:hypothetical protein